MIPSRSCRETEVQERLQGRISVQQESSRGGVLARGSASPRVVSVSPQGEINAAVVRPLNPEVPNPVEEIHQGTQAGNMPADRTPSVPTRSTRGNKERLKTQKSSRARREGGGTNRVPEFTHHRAVRIVLDSIRTPTTTKATAKLLLEAAGRTSTITRETKLGNPDTSGSPLSHKGKHAHSTRKSAPWRYRNGPPVQSTTEVNQSGPFRKKQTKALRIMPLPTGPRWRRRSQGDRDGSLQAVQT